MNDIRRNKMKNFSSITHLSCEFVTILPNQIICLFLLIQSGKKPLPMNEQMNELRLQTAIINNCLPFCFLRNNKNKELWFELKSLVDELVCKNCFNSEGRIQANYLITETVKKKSEREKKYKKNPEMPLSSMENSHGDKNIN